jgi:Phosphoglucomutase/phosphomannomutase, alpha/beta/alpha domain I
MIMKSYQSASIITAIIVGIVAALPTLAWFIPSSSSLTSSRRNHPMSFLSSPPLLGHQKSTNEVSTDKADHHHAGGGVLLVDNDVVAAGDGLVKKSFAPSFLTESFTTSECDNSNTPPSLSIVLRSIQYLFQKNKSDIRGRYIYHPSHGSSTWLSIVQALKKEATVDDQPLLTPFAAYCIGHAMGRLSSAGTNQKVVLAIGRDPRPHGTALADALARGATAAGLHVIDLGIATTPACAAYTNTHPGSLAVVRLFVFVF